MIIRYRLSSQFDSTTHGVKMSQKRPTKRVFSLKIVFRSVSAQRKCVPKRFHHEKMRSVAFVSETS